MLNLIDQSDILKGLDDGALQRELKQPNGTVPPFLLLSEISRRKDMRQRYLGEEANRAPKTTVMDDVLAAPAMPGMSGAGPGGAPGGIAAAAQMGAPQAPPMASGMPGYASGGIIDAVDPTDYQSIAAKYQAEIDDIETQKKRDAALALIAAGSGIMGAGHSNTLQNIGIGAGAGLDAYSTALKATDARETGALRGLQDIAGSQHSEALQKLQLAQSAMSPGQREFDYYKTLTPEEQQQYTNLTDPNAAYKAAGHQDDLDRAHLIAQSIAEGKQSPKYTGLYHLAPLVKAALASDFPGFNPAVAEQTYDATKRMLSTLNGPGQVRLKQAIDFTDQSIDKLGELADEWSGGQFPLLNKANLGLALQGAKGQDAQSLAARLEAQRKEVISELATVYKGGNSPTDEGLKLAETQFDSAWSKGTFEDAIKQAKMNIKYRKNSLDQLVGGVGADNPYAPDTAGAPVTAGDVAAPHGTLPTPQTPEEYAAIKSGDHFIDPEDGKEYVKP